MQNYRQLSISGQVSFTGLQPRSSQVSFTGLQPRSSQVSYRPAVPPISRLWQNIEP